jgi:hypothetical protein
MWTQDKYPNEAEWKQFKAEFEDIKDMIVCSLNQNETNTFETVREAVQHFFMDGSRWFNMMVRWIECLVDVTIYFEGEEDLKVNL